MMAGYCGWFRIVIFSPAGRVASAPHAAVSDGLLVLYGNKERETVEQCGAMLV